MLNPLALFKRQLPQRPTAAATPEQDVIDVDWRELPSFDVEQWIAEQKSSTPRTSSFIESTDTRYLPSVQSGTYALYHGGTKAQRIEMVRTASAAQIEEWWNNSNLTWERSDGRFNSYGVAGMDVMIAQNKRQHLMQLVRDDGKKR